MHGRTDSNNTTGPLRSLLAGLVGAVTFLTILPLPMPATCDARLTRSAAWFPFVGAAMGALAGGVRVLCEPAFGGTVATVLAMIVLVVATGALHQDGLADTADGLGARGDQTRRLAVMRDSATGVYGGLALIAWALLLLATLTALNADHALRALVVACALARWAALLHATLAPPARTDGLGATLTVSRIAASIATVTSVVAAVAICGAGAGSAAVGTTLVIAALTAVFARHTFGGRTGDTLGATVAIAEVAVCVVLLGLWHA